MMWYQGRMMADMKSSKTRKPRTTEHLSILRDSCWLQSFLSPHPYFTQILNQLVMFMDACVCHTLVCVCSCVHVCLCLVWQYFLSQGAMFFLNICFIFVGIDHLYECYVLVHSHNSIFCFLCIVNNHLSPSKWCTWRSKLSVGLVILWRTS